ncbi:hypothetical protein DFP72DRAFT_248163 [Ephemerocybe angulata]|uniref:Zinc finger PHD-type domain-containing protein n=1 Tax=Ephemerocybe angulata TaxID=980116 RepID=A0A8H6I374_9AGAR|nr:hypothetical protein DFP72DRAFT_248163 [Tulosesus angulatus]
MPRRSSARVSSSAAVEQQAPPPQAASDPVSENLRNLRHHWKWAAFCQFFYIFFDLVAINDVSVEDIENDLTHGTDVFLPRIMQRLLFTLSYDRKISADNWQNALRRQYDRRNPEANPLGSPSTVHTANNSRYSSVLKEEEEDVKQENGEEKEKEEGVEHDAEEAEAGGSNTASKEEEAEPKKKGGRAVSIVEEKTTVDWSELTMEQKLETLHTLLEWQFQNPARLRGIMKSDDESATWRSEPIGYDRESNAYWLIGGNRLWIQRSPPKPPTRKRKRKAAAEPEPKGRNASKAGSAKRQRVTKAQPAKTKAKAAVVAAPPTPTGRSSRAAKEQAKVKLDAQAKALAEFNRQAAATSSVSVSASGRATRSRGQAAAKAAPAPSPRKSAGTRISSRLRSLQDDGWQAVPEEWLNESASTGKKTGLEADDESISDLTELSEEEEEEEEKVEEEEVQQEEEPEEPEEPVDANFVEWETLCVTLYEWETFPEKFAKSTYYTEKAFYKLLTNVVVPEVVAELRAIEQKRKLEEALNHRKRSSRLATREHEKEAAKLAAQKKIEDDERMSRTRRAEARQQREEAERLKREKAREERRLKRETRAVEQEHEEEEDDTSSSKDGGEEERQPPPAQAPPPAQSRRTSRQQPKKAVHASADEWELNCEVCGTTGKNLDDGKPMMCCGICNKWQHIPCHDKREARLGRPKRNWDKIEFFCQRCLAQKQANGSHRYNGVSHPQQQNVHPNMAYQQQGWQHQQQVSYNPKPTVYGVPEPSAYSQSYLAPTSSVRSSYPTQTAYGNPYTSGQISFSHYQPQERAFTNEADRSQAPHNSYYRVNGSAGWGGEGSRYQQQQPQQAWNGNHHASSHHNSSVPVAPTNYYQPPNHGPLTTPATFQGSMGGGSLPPLDRGHHAAPLDANGTTQRTKYDSLAREVAYRQQQQQQQPPPPNNTAPPVSYNRTPYPPHT